MERVLYFEMYIVIEPGPSPYKFCELITEEKYMEGREKYGDKFVGGIGAEAMRECLKTDRCGGGCEDHQGGDAGHLV